MRFSLLRLIEFFVVGILLGVVEDLIAISIATDATIDARVILIAVLVALPFAIISEIIVDQKHFPQWLHRLLNRVEKVEQEVKKEF